MKIRRKVMAWLACRSRCSDCGEFRRIDATAEATEYPPMNSVNLAAMSAILGALIVPFGHPLSALAENYLCRGQFALCTSAPCIPEPGNPKVAMCSCEVEDGPNLGSVACDTLKPSTDSNGVCTVYSTFALTQWQQGKKTLTCPSGTPWTNCLNMPCTVDLANPKKAMCACGVVRTGGAWITAGGNCNTATCDTAYWSAATADAMSDVTNFMLTQLNIKKSPVKACPAPR